MIKCSNCGKEVKKGKFCPNCGLKFNEENNDNIQVTNNKFCTNCGSSIDANTKICSKCGAEQNMGIINENNNSKIGVKNEISANFKVNDGVPNSYKSSNQNSLSNNKFIALILSFLIPGLGYFYLRLPKRAILILIIAFIGVFLWTIPTLLIWIYGMYASYKSAEALSNGHYVEDKFL